MLSKLVTLGRGADVRRMGIAGSVVLAFACAGGCSESGNKDADAVGGDSQGTGNSGPENNGAGNNGDDSGGADQVVGDRRVPFSPANDRAFAEYFVEHHKMAVEMAEHVIARGENAATKDMATRMRQVQTAEIATLEGALKALDSEKAPSAMPKDPHADAEMKHMEGMSGAELDKMFLLDMVTHHATALPTTHRALPTLKRADLKKLAEEMFEAQGREIGEMRKMLTEMGVKDSGEDLAPADKARADFGLVGDRRIPMTPENDVAFIDFFVPHHEMAIEMADQVIARGADPQVKAMATMMRDVQAAEVVTMRSVREMATGKADPAPMPADSHADQEMAEMKKMSGAELDRMFLLEMITHHAGALPVTHRAVPHVTNDKLRSLTAEMFNAQATEIGMMRQMLDAMPAN